MPRKSSSSQSGSNVIDHRPTLVGVGLLLLLVASIVVGIFATSVYSQVQFADPSFRAAWERQDGPVASRSSERGWVWGPVPGRALSEPFAGIPGNSHSVQYFDKGRMEINNPNGDKNDPFYVTNGLLAVELISGQQQNGVSSYQYRGPASLNLASDMDDPSAPTYQSFNGVANIPGAPNERRSTDQTGQIVRTAIDRLGRTQPWPDNHADYAVRIARFEPATGHNIPDVFWDYLNSQGKIIQNGQQVTGPLFYPWMSVTGYPISEPYWSYVKVAGQYTDILIQAYERRILTYNPHLQVGFKVQMGNIGQHYYDWRYLNAGGTGGGPGPATPTASTLPPTVSLRIDGIFYRRAITNLNDNYVVIVNSGQQPVVFTNYWLDSPKWGHVDRYYFPAGFTLAPNAAVRVHAGVGQDIATDLYMFRTSVMWESQPYDLAIVYDNYGREVIRYFPAAETGPPPTQPVATVTPGGATTPTTTVQAQTTATVSGTALVGTSTPTKVVPTPISTTETQLVTATPTKSTATTITPTSTKTPQQ